MEEGGPHDPSEMILCHRVAFGSRTYVVIPGKVRDIQDGRDHLHIHYFQVLFFFLMLLWACIGLNSAPKLKTRLPETYSYPCSLQGLFRLRTWKMEQVVEIYTPRLMFSFYFLQLIPMYSGDLLLTDGRAH